MCGLPQNGGLQEEYIEASNPRSAAVQPGINPTSAVVPLNPAVLPLGWAGSSLPTSAVPAAVPPAVPVGTGQVRQTVILAVAAAVAVAAAPER